jgi:hypothetical protein
VTIAAPALDHAVVNVRDRMDEAVAIYRRLGFTMTARGYHTLGSINHLAVFGTNYLELVGVEPGAARQREDVLRYPVGLNGLVLATEDADALYAALMRSGISAAGPVAFSRPIEIDGAAHEARFRTVALGQDAVLGGRVYFCQHLTRELVWRAEWQRHDNGATDLVRAVVVSGAPRRAAAPLAAMLGDAAVRDTASGCAIDLGTFRLDIVTPAALVAAFGDAAPDGGGRSDYMAALTLATASLAQTAGALARGGITVKQHENRLIVPAAAAMNTTLEFVAA